MPRLKTQASEQLQNQQSQLSTDELVVLAQGGCRHAFSELLKRYYPLIFRNAFRVLKHKEDAQDAAQDAVLNVFVKLGTFRNESSFTTWLTRVSINAALMHLRKRNRCQTVDVGNLFDDEQDIFDFLPTVGPTPEQICIDREGLFRMHQAVNLLPTKLREITKHRLDFDTPIESLAAECGISVAAAKSRLLRARRSLVRRMNSDSSRRKLISHSTAA